MAERRAEIADLTRRVVVGALLTAPVLFAVMAHEFSADWVPALLLNHWMQLALITPVMFYTGWPIHRIGWLAHSAPDRGDEFADHARHHRGLRLQPAGHHRSRSVACRGPRRVLRSRRRDHHPHLVRPPAGGQSEGWHRRGAIRALLGLQARTARVVRNGAETEIPIEDVVVDDEIIIRPGRKCPSMRPSCPAPRWMSR